ncbi:MAG TPA: PAS domain-containing protein [Labilithrix sp.]|nr:PAS domain-containing protein [Labilithrix sp.]
MRPSHVDETSFDAALAESSFRAALERLPEAVVVLHRDETILYANPAAGSLFGFAKGTALLGRALGLLIDEGDHDGARDRLRAVLTTGVPSPWSPLRIARREERPRSPASVEIRGTRVVCGGKPAVLALLRSAPIG